MDSSTERLLMEHMPFPACIINGRGKVTSANSNIDEVFIYDGIKDADIFALTGIKLADFQKRPSERCLLLARNDKIFKIIANALDDQEDSPVILYFLDVTNYETLKTLYNDEKICICITNVDNFDVLSSNTEKSDTAVLLTEIDKAVRQWAAKMEASVTRYKDYMYIMVMEKSACDRLVENKFPILDDIRKIETDIGFPITLSIGIGIGGKTPAKTDEMAHAALDLALGRGGDQAVLRRGSKIEYYGGKMQTVEKGNKGKSRIIAHSLKQLIEQSSKVMIMGHRNPDMDAFGSALGVFRLAASVGKEAHIVIDRYHVNMAEIFMQAKETGAYSFVNNEKAQAIADEDTLLVVVDTHKPSITECPGLLSKAEKIVVIDHHRKTEEFIENPTLSYMEPYASSTAELVTEMLQFFHERKNFSKFEAEALLAGITVDTNRFAGKTGVRTFEAASWLRRAGADTSAVKRFFQSDRQAFKIKADSIAKAEFLDCGAALSICEGSHPDMQVLNAQTAEMLLDVKGIKASFVAGLDGEGVTTVSARSFGEINVQTIMEEFGGGGHLMTAGAQTKLSPREVMEKLKEHFRAEVTK
ncbi:MAG: DHH family phosphoesterase [Clostridiales bacterium]|nr:DHH family phosphoesterase [Clostridiales bacterium]